MPDLNLGPTVIRLLSLALATACATDPTRDPIEAGYTSSAKEGIAFEGHTWIVDDDGVQCSEPDFTTIQEAVNAAQMGDTVKVCAGTYDETVTVTKSIRLYGAKKGKDATLRTLDPSKESIVIGAAPFNLVADHVVLDGFWVKELLVGDFEDDEQPGVKTSGDYSGYVIQNNVIESETNGLFPRSSGIYTTYIKRNLFLGAWGIVTGEIDGFGTAIDEVIEHNRLEGARMFFSGAGDTDVRIRYNTLAGGEGIVLSSVYDFTIEENRFNAPIGNAITVSNAEGVTIRDNTMRNGLANGVHVTYATSDVVVEDNQISGFVEAGVAVAGYPPYLEVEGATVRGNEIEDGGAGVLLVFASGCEVSDNDVEDNVRIGIEASPDAVDNVISGNEARGNGLDCRDTSKGDGTEGTDNTWTDNEGSTSEPEGLCSD